MTLSDLLREVFDLYDQTKKKMDALQDVERSAKSQIYFLECQYTLLQLSKLLEVVRNNPALEITRENVQPFVDFLDRRWELIQGTNLIYPCDRLASINKLCLTLASALSQSGVIKENDYQLMMPTVMDQEDLVGNSFSQNDLKLHEFILSDDNTHFITLAACFQRIEMETDEVRFRYTSDFTDPETKKIKFLTDSEENRVIYYSPETKKYFEAIQSKLEMDKTKTGNSIGHYLERFSKSLWKGGIQGGKQPSREFLAVEDADYGLMEFKKFLEMLTNEERSWILALPVSPNPKETLGGLWGDLCRLQDQKSRSEDLSPQYCVDQASKKIDWLLGKHPELYTKFPEKSDAAKIEMTKLVTERVEAAKKDFKEAMKQESRPSYTQYDSNQSSILLSKRLFSKAIWETLTKEEKEKLITILNQGINTLDKFIEINKIITKETKEEMIPELRALFDSVLCGLLLHASQDGRAIYDIMFSLPEEERRNCQNIILDDEHFVLPSLVKNITLLRDFLFSFHNSERQWDLIEKLGIERIKEMMNKSYSLFQYSNLEEIIGHLSEKKRVEFLQELGENYVVEIIKTKYKNVSDMFKKEKSSILYQLDTFSTDSLFFQERVCKELDVCLRLLLIAYRNERTQEIQKSNKEYSYPWQGFFGGSAGGRKIKAVTALEAMMNLSQNETIDLKPYEKELHQGMLGDIYAIFEKIQEAKKSLEQNRNLQPSLQRNM